MFEFIRTTFNDATCDPRHNLSQLELYKTFDAFVTVVCSVQMSYHLSNNLHFVFFEQYKTRSSDF